MHDLARNSLLILSVFVLFGGIMGYTQAKSKASLIAGVLSAVALGAAFAVSLTHETTGVMMGAGFATVLEVIFGIRLFKTKKFMPAGMMLSLCFVVQVILVHHLITAK